MAITRPISEEQAKLINPITLAFLGDAVYSLWVRERLTLLGSGKAAELQRAASVLLSARGQSAFLERVLPMFTAAEEEIFRRGRNAKKATKSKNASPAEYNRSTGFEAVIGYLYLTGQDERIDGLLSQTDEKLLQGQAAQKVFKP